MRPFRILTILLALFLCNYVAKAANGDVSFDTVPDYNGWGWDALVVDNGIIQLVIIPDIGGRVMFYGFDGDEYLAVNEGQMGHVYDPDVTNNGPWSSWGYGGYKCWPAPQSRWNWPPPPHLDWGVYSYATEHSSTDSVVIYLESEVETKLAAGLQQARRFRIYKNSTKVAVEQILKNVSNVNDTWSIWEVSQVLPNHGTGDNNNISTYFHAKAADVKKLQNGSITTTAINDTIRKYNENNSGKIGILVNPGWCCYVDERDEQAYAKVFNVYPDETYPDNNTNLQFYAGSNYTEIEVLSPIYTIPQGSSASFTEFWYASHTKGAMQHINHAGSILSGLYIESEFMVMSGIYGIYQSGKLKLDFYDAEGNVLGSIDTFNVQAAQKYEILVEDAIPVGTSKVFLLAYDHNEKFIDTLDFWPRFNNFDNIDENIASSHLEIYPNITEKESVVNLYFSNFNSSEMTLSLIDIKGQIIEKYTVNIQNFDTTYQYKMPAVSSGIYILSIQSGSYMANSKIIVK